jgi:type IV pilus assembly protein PilB
MAEKMKLGELLMEAGLIDRVQLQSALAHQKKWDIKLGAALIEMKFISEQDLASFLAQQLNVKCVSIMEKELSPEVVNALEPEIAKKYHVFPLEVREKELVVATSDPSDLGVLDELSFRLGKRIRAELALESEVRRAIRYYYDNVREDFSRHPEKDAPVVDRIRMVFDEGSRPAETPARKEVTTKTVLEALLAVLERKGVLTRAEVMDEIRKRQE